MSVAAMPAMDGIRPEIAVAAIPDDERVWVPQAPGVRFRPLLLNTVSGGWCKLLRLRQSGVLSRHQQPMLVVGDDDGRTKIGMCRRQYADVGLGAAYTNQFVR